MKALVFCLLSVLLLGSCNPLSLDDDGRGGTPRDSAKGQLKLPEIKDISKGEVLKSDSDCTKYSKVAVVSIPGSPVEGWKRCLAKAIDEGLKPLCEQERNAKALLREHKRKGDDEAVEEIEIYLEELEETKYDFANELYGMADEFDEQVQYLLDEMDEQKEVARDNADKTWQRFFNGLTWGAGKLVVKMELGGFTRILDSRARQTCPGIDLSKIQSRRK